MYNHAPEDYICPFCRLIEAAKDKQNRSMGDMIYRDEIAAAFIGSHQWPNNPGNVIVIPAAHYENVYDLPVELAGPIHALVKKIAIAMKEAWACDGISTRQHNEPAGYQDVWHYHVHVTPRYHGDELYVKYSTECALMPPEERTRLANELRSKMEW